MLSVAFRGSIIRSLVSVFASNPRLRSSPLHAHGDAHAAADAERGEAFLGVALFHLMEQRDEDACAGGADRVAERDCTAIDVDLARVPAEILVDRAGLGRESLVRFDEVEVLDLP